MLDGTEVLWGRYPRLLTTSITRLLDNLKLKLHRKGQRGHPVVASDVGIWRRGHPDCLHDVRTSKQMRQKVPASSHRSRGRYRLAATCYLLSKKSPSVSTLTGVRSTSGTVTLCLPGFCVPPI